MEDGGRQAEGCGGHVEKVARRLVVMLNAACKGKAGLELSD